MTDATTMQPLGITRLEPGQRACGHCGMPADTTATEKYPILASESPNPKGGRFIDAHSEIEFGVCVTCHAVGVLAGRLLDEHPSIQRRIGDRAIGVHRLWGALDALRVIDITPPTTLTAEALTDLLRLTSLGVAARWVQRFAPVMWLGASTKQAASAPWLFVDADTRKYISHEYAQYLGNRLPPKPVACPDGGGCTLCGVGTIDVPRGKASNAWQPFHADARALGGRGGGRIDGFLCRICSSAYAVEGAVGPSLLQRAATAYLVPDRLNATMSARFDGFRAWAVSGRSKPNREPWDHLNLDPLRAVLGLRRVNEPTVPSGPTYIDIDPGMKDSGPHNPDEF